jgi:isocitrate/isopropylmalate dehydrogenase
MAFRIEPTNRPEDNVDFEVVTNDGETHNVSLPKNDCLPNETVAEIREMLNSVEETDLKVEVEKTELKIIAGHKHDEMFDKLTQRQINQMREHYRQESEGDLGESSASES